MESKTQARVVELAGKQAGEARQGKARQSDGPTDASYAAVRGRQRQASREQHDMNNTWIDNQDRQTWGGTESE